MKPSEEQTEERSVYVHVCLFLLLLNILTTVSMITFNEGVF